MKSQKLIDAIIVNVWAYFACKLIVDLIAIIMGA